MTIGLEAAARKYNGLLQNGARSLGLTVSEVIVLNSLLENDGQRASDLARIAARPATSFTPILDGLVNKGLVERNAHELDSRAIRIILTNNGKKLNNDIRNVVNSAEDEVRRILGQDFDAFKSSLDRFSSY